VRSSSASGFATFTLLPSIFWVTRRTLATLGVLTLIGGAGACSLAVAAPGSVAQPPVFRVLVGTPQGQAIAPDFLGLALEYRDIPALVGDDPKAVNPVLVQLIRNLVPKGRPMLRIGGQSTDRSWWPVRGVAQPRGVSYSLTPSWTASARALAQAANARLTLGLGLEANQPKLDAVEAYELLRRIGRRYVEALEIGNEPELYTAFPWYRTLHGAILPWYRNIGAPIFSRPRGYNPQAFLAEFSRAVQAVPRAAIAGPATGNPLWLGQFARILSPASRVKVITWHAYGLNQCIKVRSSPYYPTVPNLLSPLASRGIVNGISPSVALAHRAGASFRVGELGSVTCNGKLGVSNTFASALWATDALFSIAADGVDGINLHTFQNAANGLFDFQHSGGHWQATVHPLYYGVLMFAQAAPPGSRLLRLSAPNQTQVRVWATQAPDRRIRVLLINDSLTHAEPATVRAPAAAGPASLERLLGLSAYATSPDTLGGQSFGTRTASGLLAPQRSTAIAPRGGRYAVTLPAASAALLTLSPGH